MELSGALQDITSSLHSPSDTQRTISNLANSSISRNNNSESSEKNVQQQPEGQDVMHLIQVLSPYVVDGGDDEYSPLDLNQWAAIASIQRAQRHLKYPIHLDFVCAVLESDQEALAHLPCRQVLLTRSTQTEYPDLQPPKAFPFLQDIYEASTAGTIQEFYWMYTNADIGLTKHFYRHLYDLLQTQDAVSVNRVTIPMEKITHTNSTNSILSQVDSLLKFGRSHPGYDCFVIHSSVLQRINFGDFLSGRPPWGANVHLSLKIMAQNYTNIKSNRRLTFHLGNDKSKWSFERSNSSSDLALLYDDFFNFCPYKNAATDCYGLQNGINCGRWFSPNRQHHNLSIPTFVQPGYEEMYSQRHSQFINVTDDGHPETTNSTDTNTTKNGSGKNNKKFAKKFLEDRRREMNLVSRPMASGSFRSDGLQAIAGKGQQRLEPMLSKKKKKERYKRLAASQSIVENQQYIDIPLEGGGEDEA
jgi:hypothetical protein